jgi:hypothetical protein
MSVHGSGMAFTEEQFRQLATDLKQARTARSRSLDDIASQTKINRRHLEAIEAGDLSRLPQGPYVKAFIREYARAVGVPVPAEFAVFTGAPAASSKDPKVISHIISEKGIDAIAAPISEAAREATKFANTAVKSAVKTVTKTTENVAHMVETGSKEALEVLTSKSLWEEAEDVRRERQGLPPLTKPEPAPQPAPVVRETPRAEPKPSKPARVISKKATNAVIVLLVLLFGAAMYFTIRMYRTERGTQVAGNTDYIPAPVEPNVTPTTPKRKATPAAAPTTVATTTPAVTPNDSLHFTLRATQPVWVSIVPDGLPAYRGEMRAGETRSVKAAQKIILNIGNQKAVEMQLDGQKLSNLPTIANSNVVIRNLVLTKNHANLGGQDVDWKVLTSAPPPAPSKAPAIQQSVAKAALPKSTQQPAHNTVNTAISRATNSSTSKLFSTPATKNGTLKQPTVSKPATQNGQTQKTQKRKGRDNAPPILRSVDPIPPGP